jgi:hypothetical protein
LSVCKFIEFRSLSIPSAHWMLWPRRMVDPSVLTLQQQSSTQAIWLTLASYFQTQTREHLSLTMLRTLAELVKLFLCYLENLGLQLCCWQQYNYAFLPTFTETGHIKGILRICKFVSYSALWHTLKLEEIARANSPATSINSCFSDIINILLKLHIGVFYLYM